MGYEREEYSQKLKNGEPVSYKFTVYNHKIRELTLSLISQYLAHVHLNHIHSSIFTFVNEMVNNAIKANLKRVYFKEKEVDLNDAEAYSTAIQSFNEEAVSNLEAYEEMLREEGLFVQVKLQHTDQGLYLRISNNTGMTTEELTRVRTRIAHALQYNSLEDAFESFQDQTEGGGLGLILNIILLKKTGIDPSSFKLESDGKATASTLLIPPRVGKPDDIKQIEEKILYTLRGIPPFPDTINSVIEACDNPQSSINAVAAIIERDPGLSADILKVANSPSFYSNNRVNTIQNAVSRLGLKSTRHLTLAMASKGTLEKNFKIFQGFWEHSFKCAFYAKQLAERQNLKLQIESIYMGGLLHDMGKIILYSIDPDGMKEINGLALDRTRTTSATLEEIRLGISHAHIGAVVAENWGFSQDLVEMIRNHHRPFASPEPFRKQTSIIHIANAFCNIEERKGNYVYIDLEAYIQLGMKNMDEVYNLHRELQELYETMKKN